MEDRTVTHRGDKIGPIRDPFQFVLDGRILGPTKDSIKKGPHQYLKLVELSLTEHSAKHSLSELDIILISNSEGGPQCIEKRTNEARDEICLRFDVGFLDVEA